MKFKKLLNVVDCYESKVDEEVKMALKSFGVVDSMPSGLIPMEEVIEKYKNGDPNYSAGSTVICIGKVGDLWSDPTYNRIAELRYNNQKKHITDRGGFSYNAADTLSAFLRPDATPVLTKGNNRASKRYACGRNNDARVVISLKLHSKEVSYEEMIRIESLDHNTDCNYRTSQSGDDKFKSAYFAQDSWAVEMFDFLAQYNIGVAGTLDGARFQCLSHSYIDSAIRTAGKENTQRYLKAFTDNNCEEQLMGSASLAGALFIKYFTKYISDVDRRNGIDSFSDMMNWWFNEYGEESRSIANPDTRNLTQSDITKGAGDNKCKEFFVAKFVYLYNTFCRAKRLEISGSQKTAIPFDGSKNSGWMQFVDSANAWMKPNLMTLATTPIL